MGKKRISIPKKVSDSVLKEYSHKCAICGGDNPQLHHIDENPSNNDELNLIPLCANCHLTDQHDPTRRTDPGKLQLLRKYKDPTVLSPQFHVLFNKMSFLNPEFIDKTPMDELERLVMELIDFVNALQMGNFYSKRLSEILILRLVKEISPADFERVKKSGMSWKELEKMTREASYRKNLKQVIKPVTENVIELLRFQGWELPKKS